MKFRGYLARSGKVKFQTPRVEKTAEPKKSNGRSKKRKACHRATHEPVNSGKEIYDAIERQEYTRQLRTDNKYKIYEDSDASEYRENRNTKKPQQLHRSDRLYFDNNEN
jgi:ribosomal protein S30